MKYIHSLTASQLRQAAELKERIEELQKQLGQLLGIKTVPISRLVSKYVRKKHAAAKAKKGSTQKAAWAKVKPARARPVPVPPKK